ncbi:MAG: hypothetical protein HYU69_10680 [Bacteroidetes bacterium]|nr:hypothetical protein [Bacteroidota bacterium]
MLLLTVPLTAQNSFYIVPQFDFGTPLSEFKASPRVLNTKFWRSYQMQGGISVKYRVAEIVGIELGFTQNQLLLSYNDQQFSSRNKGFDTELRNKVSYYGLFANIHFVFLLSETSRLCWTGGYGMNMMKSGVLSESKLFMKNNETVSANTNYLAQNTCVNTDISYEHLLRGRNTLSIGLKFNLGLDNVLNGDYSVMRDGSVIESEQFASKGTFVGLSIKYGFRFIFVEKRVKKPKVKVSTPVKPADTTVAVVNPVIVDPVVKDPIVIAKDENKNVEIAAGKIPKEIAGREVKLMKKVSVRVPKVTIRVYDSGTVDGDIVSLNMNGKWILENYQIRKTPYIFTAELQEGTNILVLHAMNLGSIPPNTASILIDEGGKKQHMISLKSSLSTSGTVEIDYKPSGK